MEFAVSGRIVTREGVIEGSVVVRDGKIHQILEGEKDGLIRGIIIPARVNAHTHVGDSSLRDPPYMPLDRLVGRGGLKYGGFREEGIRSAVCEIARGGIFLFSDFREEGVEGDF